MSEWSSNEPSPSLIAFIFSTTYRADLATNIYPGNPALDARFSAMTSALTGQGFSLAEAQPRALAMLDGTMMRQASMQAYNDSWLLLFHLLRGGGAGGVAVGPAEEYHGGCRGRALRS